MSDHRLSARELAVLRAVGLGVLRKQLGAELGVSQHTARNQLASAYRKLDATTAIDALRNIGWLRIPTDEELASWVE